MFPFGRTFRRIMLLIITFRLSYEQILAFAFRKLGPVIAIGKPEERLPELGALREYVEEDRWKKRVTELAAKSRLVVMQIGTSDGLIWELGRLVNRFKPEKLILAVPQRTRGWRRFIRIGLERKRQKTYRVFRQKTVSVFPQPLPERIGRSQFIYFESKWRPRLSKPPKPRLFPRIRKKPEPRSEVGILNWLNSVLVHQTMLQKILLFVYAMIRVLILGLFFILFLYLLDRLGLLQGIQEMVGQSGY